MPAEMAPAGGKRLTRLRRRLVALRIASSDRPLLVILAAALLLRGAVIAFSRDFAPIADPADYDRIGVSLAAGHGFGPTALAEPGTASALRPPLYPLLLGATYRIAGHSWTAARAVEAVLGVVFVLLVFLLARHLYDRRVGLVAAVLAAMMPTLVLLNASLLSETLFMPLEIAAVLAALTWRRKPSAGAAVAAGIACGAATMTRSVGLALLVGLVVIIATAAAPRAARLRAIAVVAATAALVVLPWAIRNAYELNAFVPVSTQGGPTAAGVYNRVSFADDKRYAMWHPPFFIPQFQPLFFDGLNEAELDSRLRDSALRYARAHPGDVGTVVGLNILRMFFDAGRSHTQVARAWYDEQGVPRWLQPLLGWFVRLLSAAVLLTLAAAAFGRLRIRHWYVWITPLLLCASVLPLHGGNRYGAPAAPFLIILASVGIAAVLTRRRESGGAGERPASA